MSNTPVTANPTDIERQFQRTAQLYVVALKALRRPVSHKIKSAANDVHCQIDYGPALYELLEKRVTMQASSLFSSLVELLSGDAEDDAEEFDTEIKTEEDRLALARLALWWVNHRVAFLKRRRDEDLAKRSVEALRASARAKLTPDERKAVGLD